MRLAPWKRFSPNKRRRRPTLLLEATLTAATHMAEAVRGEVDAEERTADPAQVVARNAVLSSVLSLPPSIK